MRLSAWMGIFLLLTTAVLCIGSVSLEMARPGKLLCPLRRILEERDIDPDDYLPDFLEEVTDVEEDEAKERSQAFRETALARFPGLHIEARAVPLAENGYWQLVQLEDHPIQPTAGLKECLEDWDPPDPEALGLALADNDPWLRHLERIASLDATSNMELPSESWFVSFRQVRMATRTLLARSLIEASGGDETAALRTFHTTHAFTRHLQDLEAPYLMGDIIAVYTELEKAGFFFRYLLPAIGPDADLDRWQRELWQIDIHPARGRKLALGEWHTITQLDYLTEIWRDHYRHQLIDPDETAMVITEIITRFAESAESIRDIDSLTDIPSFRNLTPEGQEWAEMTVSGFATWDRGITHVRRHKALHQAACELLKLEKQQGKLAAADISGLTQDPATGTSFAFDPAKGLLSAPAKGRNQAIELTLPWRKHPTESPSNPPQE